MTLDCFCCDSARSALPHLADARAGSWQSLTFWTLFRGGMVADFAVAALDWNTTPLLDWTRFIPGLPLGCRSLHHRLRLFQSRPRQYLLRSRRPGDRRPLSLQPQPAITASIVGLIGLSIGANSILTIALSAVMIGAYVMMALVEEDWLKQLYGAPYRDYCRQTARFLDIQGLIALVERRKPSRETS